MSDLIERLREAVGASAVLTGDRLEDYRYDGTFLEGDAIAAVLPGSTEDVQKVLEICVTTTTPIFPRGRGTSLVGGPVPVVPGVVVSLERLDWIDVDPTAMVAVVGAGAITGRIQEVARSNSLMYPPDPASASMSSIGGNVACNAGGMGCLKYGLTGDYVLGMTVVLVDGTVLKLGGRTRKRSSGYRLAQLFVGSEGTLGLITEITVKLIPLPPYRALASVSFDSLDAAGEAVLRLLTAGYLPSALEIMDGPAIELVESMFPTGFQPPPAALLFVEQDGRTEEAVLGEVLAMTDLLGGTENRIAQSSTERERLWEVRRSFGKALIAMPNGYFSEDIAVPIGAIPEMLRRIRALATETGLSIATAGHAGDGNLHPCLLFNADQRHLVGGAAVRLFEDAVALGGTISAEHGLGALKRDHAILEHQPEEIQIWRSLKQRLDPENLLNPHKLLPEGPADAQFLERHLGWGSTRRTEAAV